MATRGATNSPDVSVFGQFLSECMERKEMTLRELARETGIDASNLSKIERGVAYPPKKESTLQKMISALGLNNEESERFIDLANLVNGMMPPETDRSNDAIPLLLRAINNKRLTREQTLELAQLVTQENEWQGRIME